MRMPAWECLALVVGVAVSLDVALAQTGGKSPFGIGDATPNGSTAPGGLVAWMLAKQAEYTRAMITALRATRDGAGLWTLLGIAFAYGVFHAAGPGHGKAVVSSYVFANEQALRRGIGVAVAAAMLQAVVAITLVVPAVAILGATARQIDRSVAWIEIFSFSAIIMLGLSLVWRKARALRGIMVGQAAPHVHSPECGHEHHAHTPHVHTPHVHGPHCGHAHLPEASTLTGNTSWRDLAAATFAAGTRPCSGAIILLAFALSAGALTAGILSVFAMAAGTALTTAGFAAGAVLAKKATLRLADKSERLALLSTGLELTAAVLVVALGTALLVGYLSAG